MTNEDVTTLQKHQTELLGMLSEVDVALATTGPTKATALALIRWRLTRALRSYQLFKHLKVLDPLIARGKPQQRSLALGMKERCIATGEKFDAHVLRWSTGGIESAWPDYNREANQIAATLRRHLEREQRELTFLLDGARQPGPERSTFPAATDRCA